MHFKQVTVGEEDWSRKGSFPKPFAHFTSTVELGYNVIKRKE
jgi:hypothetical protein